MIRKSRFAFLGYLLAAAALGAAAPARGQYTLTTLASFDGMNGYNPYAGLIADTSGNLYGATLFSVFEVAADTHALTTIATFNGANGSRPIGSLIADANGNLYGTTVSGGANNQGTVFEIAAGTRALTTLATFNGANGSSPQTTLLADANGDLYGTTIYGGANNQGTVFEVAAGTGTITTLVSFNGVNGSGPDGALLSDAHGNLYSTTYEGGANNQGTVFEVAAGTHALTTLATFKGTNGAHPWSSLIADPNGNLYGTTTLGGANNQGTVFEVFAGTHALTTLATFNGANGANPYTGLVADSSGNLYGTTELGGVNNRGTVFKLAADTHALTTLATFNGANGSRPIGGLIADGNGNLYGTTFDGGNSDFDASENTGYGSVFELVNALSPAVPVGIGLNQAATTGGGPGAVGGGEAVLPTVTAGGTFTNNYQPVTSLAALQVAIGASATSAVNFGLVGQNPDGTIAPGSAIQLWDLHFSGTFTGSATITLHYDPTLVGDVPPSEFQIWHYTGGSWVPVANETIDTAADTITFTTDSFSPFILGVPEPSTFVLAALGILGLSAARKHGSTALLRVAGH